MYTKGKEILILVKISLQKDTNKSKVFGLKISQGFDIVCMDTVKFSIMYLPQLLFFQKFVQTKRVNERIKCFFETIQKNIATSW